MRQDYETSKLYYGFPVILLGYKDANFKYNFTTNSSSYTLGDMMVIGFHSRSNAAKQIMNFKEFTVNVPSENLMNEIEIGGFFHKLLNDIHLIVVFLLLSKEFLQFHLNQ